MTTGATEAVAPAIELIDSRIRDWNVRIADTIADNASSAGYVLGPDRVKPTDIDLLAIDARLMCNGEQVAEGRSDAVLGNPATAVAWLARKVASFGVTLEAGDVIAKLDFDPYSRSFRNSSTHLLAPKLDEATIRAALKGAHLGSIGVRIRSKQVDLTGIPLDDLPALGRALARVRLG